MHSAAAHQRGVETLFLLHPSTPTCASKPTGLISSVPAAGLRPVVGLQDFNPESILVESTRRKSLIAGKSARRCENTGSNVRRVKGPCF